MTKIKYLLALLILFSLSCNKPPIVLQDQEVVFTATESLTGFKTADAGCDQAIAHYALVTIQPLTAEGIADGVSFQRTIDIFYLNNTMYTSTLKLAPGKFQVISFILLNNGGDNLPGTGDEIAVYATPDDGSSYGGIVTDALPINFDVNAFMKNEVKIEVVCFAPSDYDKFGFSWFALDVINVNANGFCFFGDICLDEADLEYYSNTPNLYQNQTNGIKQDMSAIFRMKVSRWNPVEPNLGTPPNNDSQMWDKLLDVTNQYPEEGETYPLFGEGAPLCVQNFEAAGEVIRYSLWVYMKKVDGGEYWNDTYDDVDPDTPGFGYRFVKSWYSTDTDKPIDIDDDGILDFAIGDCSPSADLILKYEDL